MGSSLLVSKPLIVLVIKVHNLSLDLLLIPYATFFFGFGLFFNGILFMSIGFTCIDYTSKLVPKDVQNTSSDKPFYISAFALALGYLFILVPSSSSTPGSYSSFSISTWSRFALDPSVTYCTW